MSDYEKKDFQVMMNVVMQTYRQPSLNRESLIVWWHKLVRFEFCTVRSAFDRWLEEGKFAPAPADIIPLCKPQPQFHKMLSAPIKTEENRIHSAEMQSTIQKMRQPTDYRAWAKKILADTRNYPEISVRMAREAMNMPEYVPGAEQ